MIIIGIFFAFFLGVIGVKAIYLQVFHCDRLSEAAIRQIEKSVITLGERGSILDSKLREIAVSIDTTSIAAFPVQIQDVPHTANLLSRVLKLDKDALLKSFISGKRFVWVKRQAKPSEAEKVKNLKLKGISFVTERSRFYPHKTLAAQLLGFSGVDGHGLEGIEYFYNNELKGESQKYTVFKDALGREFEPPSKIIQPKKRHHIVLTMDQTIQYIVETALENGVKASAAKSAMAIVMVPDTGAILAMANYPFFNPNAFSDFHQQWWRNRTITDSFEPGSTMKIFTAAAALSSGLVKADTLFFAENGKYKIGRNVVHDTRPRGWLSLTQIIKYSSNIGAVKIVEKIGAESFYKTLYGFGFGDKTGINCPGETTGMLLPYYRWSRIDTSAIAFGQGISVSAIQLAAATGAIANGGVLMRPYVVQAVIDQNGTLVKQVKPQPIRQVISPESAQIVSQMMATVVEDGGTGTPASLEGYTVCGKTGTAQKVDIGGYAKGKYTASFVGFAPAEHPEIVVVVIIDEPQKEHYGGIVAAPVFREIALNTLVYMNISPKKDINRFRASIGNGKRR